MLLSSRNFLSGIFGRLLIMLLALLMFLTSVLSYPLMSSKNNSSNIEIANETLVISDFIGLLDIDNKTSLSDLKSDPGYNQAIKHILLLKKLQKMNLEYPLNMWPASYLIYLQMDPSPIKAQLLKKIFNYKWVSDSLRSVSLDTDLEKMFFNSLKRQRNYRLRSYNISELSKTVEISMSKIEDYYLEHKHKFILPERYKLDYLLIDKKDLVDKGIVQSKDSDVDVDINSSLPDFDTFILSVESDIMQDNLDEQQLELLLESKILKTDWFKLSDKLEPIFSDIELELKGALVDGVIDSFNELYKIRDDLYLLVKQNNMQHAKQLRLDDVVDIIREELASNEIVDRLHYHYNGLLENNSESKIFLNTVASKNDIISYSFEKPDPDLDAHVLYASLDLLPGSIKDSTVILDEPDYIKILNLESIESPASNFNELQDYDNLVKSYKDEMSALELQSFLDTLLFIEGN